MTGQCAPNYKMHPSREDTKAEWVRRLGRAHRCDTSVAWAATVVGEEVSWEASKCLGELRAGG